ncbi:glycosyl transferase [Jannaschia sp. Os4]|uniref:DUF5928 domain-containing protein n=1 Tax=Jannaschia sp. Os4 TaxID=2807617 RepID=UPI001939A243|nr:DUF5928 domain-containing protein [Jannaschia sp. Os4]MBM2575233.1 glycosyl transferase [Jannaschia sp. Os4]
MAKIAFILLCHKDPDAIVRQAEDLTSRGDGIAIHFDARAPDAAYRTIREKLAHNPNVAFATKRVKGGWGGWSLVQGTLNAVEAALEAFPRATHFYMVSGDCRAIKSAAHAKAMLDARDADWIESFDFFASDWIKTGIKDERLTYRHWFNERTHKRLFYASMDLQRRLGLQRSPPEDIEPMIGSQWWCLRRSTIEKVMAFRRERPEVERFFRTTWIPDETYFQTLVRHLVPRTEIESRTLTFLIFTDYGMPATFHNDHYDLLVAQDFLFARKISPEARELQERLGALWASDRRDFPVAGDGRRMFAFLTSRGREGRRFAQRFWEREASLGREREVTVLVCKKWHVAKRLAARAREVLDWPVLDYLFDEEEAAMPDLGGAERGLEKRNRHRRATLRLLLAQAGGDRLAFCLDPARFDILSDLHADRNVTRTLLIDVEADDAYLRGHAARVGLIGDATPEATVETLMPTLRQDFAQEAERIREADLPGVARLAPSMDEDARAAAIAEAFDCAPDQAREIARAPHLFDD